MHLPRDNPGRLLPLQAWLGKRHFLPDACPPPPLMYYSNTEGRCRKFQQSVCYCLLFHRGMQTGPVAPYLLASDSGRSGGWGSCSFSRPVRPTRWVDITACDELLMAGAVTAYIFKGTHLPPLGLGIGQKRRVFTEQDDLSTPRLFVPGPQLCKDGRGALTPPVNVS